MELKILLVEDDRNKLNTIASFLQEIYFGIKIEYAMSYQSGVDLAMKNLYNLLLLDMSIPNYDTEGNDSSEDTLKNGGELIIHELLDENIEFDCTIITQYETINDEPLSVIDERLRELCGNKYHGYIQYQTYTDEWKQNLKNNIDHVINTNNR
jgi:CheY-like chemotaxis protein